MNSTTGAISSQGNAITLRSAVIAANAHAGADTINLLAGTYQLSIAPVMSGTFGSGNFDKAAYVDATGSKYSLNGSLDVTDALTLTGAGQTQTIIDGGRLDNVFTLNPFNITTGLSAKTAGIAVSMSGLTLQNGKNPSDDGVNGYAAGGAIWFDAGFNGAPSGSGSLTLSSVTITNNSTFGGGGAMVLYDGGTVSITNSTISNNTVNGTSLFAGADGGGIIATLPAPNGTLTLTNTSVTGNAAIPFGQGGGSGGGIEIVGGASPYTVAIHGGSISNNTAPSGGGIEGISLTKNVTIDSGTVISGNTATVGSGGGIEDDASITLAAGTVVSGNHAAGSGGGLSLGGGSSVTRSTITGNTAGVSGGGIYFNNGADASVNAAAPSVSFSTVASNTASAGANEIGNANVPAVLTDNWLGTNLPGPADVAPTNAVAISTIGPTSPGSTVTATTALPHGFVSGQTLSINGVADSIYDGFIGITGSTFPGVNVTSPTTFTFTSGQAPGGTTHAASSGGFVDQTWELLSASESGSTVTLTGDQFTRGAAVGQSVYVSGISSAGYDGLFVITAASGNSFSYTAAQTGLPSINPGGGIEIGNAVPLARNISTVTESGTTVTVNTNGANGLAAGNIVRISGVGVAGYNGIFVVRSATSTSFTYTAGVSGLASSAGGNVSKLEDSALQLHLAVGSSLVELGHSTTVTADFLTDSANAAVTAADLSTLVGRSISFAASNGTISNAQSTIQSSGTAGATFTAGNVTGAASASATVDSQIVTDPITVQAHADFALPSNTDSPDPVIAGNNLTYTIDFINNGPDTGLSPTVTDALPAGTTFVSATAPAGWTRSDSVVVGGTGSIVFTKIFATNGETATFTITVKVPSSAANGATISDSAVVGTNDVNTIDTVVGNNTASASTGVITQADLEVTTLSASPNSVAAGNNVTYTIDVTNNGPSDAAGATVSDPLPAGTTFVSAQVLTGSGWSRTDSVAVGANGTIVFSDADLIAGATASFTIVANVPSTTTAGSNALSDTATVATTTTDPTPGNNSKTATTSVSPAITPSTASLSILATSLTINGAGFDPSVANDVITFSGGVTGSVTGATATSLTISNLTGLSVGPLDASITVNGVSGGPAVQVATVAPAVTSSNATLPANATTMTINGAGFDPVAAHNTVTFFGGATGVVTSATATQLTVTSLQGLISGALDASVTTDGASSGALVQVATVIPVVTTSVAVLPANATSLTISGFGFDPAAANDTVTFSGGVTGTVTAATPTQLSVSNLTGLTTGGLDASVTTDTESSGAGVQVATVIPVVTGNVTALPATATSITLSGFGFDPTAANNTVTFSGGVTGTVTAATATQLTVTGLSNLVGGPLTASVTTDGESSGAAVEVASVTPVVTMSTANIQTTASTLTINGFGFDSMNAANSITFSPPVTGSITSSSSTQLVFTFSSAPTLGVLSATVTTNGVSSGAPVEVANVINKADQTISFTAPTSPITFVPNETVNLVATGGGSGNPVVFSIDPTSTGTGSISGSTLTVTAAGTVVLDANEAGNANFNDAPQVQQTLVVNKASQAISFTAPTTPISFVPNGTVNLVATGGASISPVVFSIDPSSTGTGSISGSTLTITGVGTFVLNANQGGDANYNPAPQVQQTLVVNKADQTISFTAPTSPITFLPNETVNLVATGGGSGNAVVFSIDPTSTGSGSISGSTLTVTGVGSIVIDANQAGNSNYNAAAQAQQTLVVGKATPTLVATAGNPVVVGTGATLTASATLSGGISETGHITFSLFRPNGTLGATETVTVNGNGVYSTPTGVLPTVAGVYQWVASYSGDGTNNGASTVKGATPQTAVGAGVTVAGNVLFLVGGNTSDRLVVVPVGASNTGSSGVLVTGTLNGSAFLEVTHSFSSIYYDGFNGNDTILFATSLTLPTTVIDGTGNDTVSLGNGDNSVSLGNGNDYVAVGNGSNNITVGNGNDTIHAGDGNNLIIEGTGHDQVIAGDGNNLIVGGRGTHSIQAGNGRNILIDGSVQLSNAALVQILNTWNQAATPANIASIRSQLKNNVTYNTASNTRLVAGSGLDWFWFTNSRDQVNKKATDLLN